MQTKITDKIWQDPEFEELEGGEKLAVFWLLTRCNALGWVEVSEKRFVFETGFDATTLQGACKGLARGFKRFSRGIWIRNYIRRQFTAGPSLARSNMASSLIKQLADVPDEVRDLILTEYPELNKPLPSPLGAPPKGQGEGEGVREGTGVEGGVGETDSGELELDTDGGPGERSGRWRKVWSERIYQAFPRKVGRAAALKAIGRVLQRGEVGAEALLDAVRGYAKAVRAAGTEQQFIPHCSTWINAGRWEDDPTEWAVGGEKKEGGAANMDAWSVTTGPPQSGIRAPEGWQELAQELFGIVWAKWEDVNASEQRQIRKAAAERMKGGE